MSDKVKKETAKERRRRQIVHFHDSLLSYPTVAQAAEAAGITPRTATRWLKTPEFKEIYVESRRATLESSSALLRASSAGSIEALAEIVRDPKAPATARVAASRAVLDVMLRITEMAETDKRLAALEAAAERVNNG